MPLHPKILHQFNLIPLDSIDEHSLYAPWNMLLNYLFPMTDGWVVAPQLCKFYRAGLEIIAPTASCKQPRID